MTRNCDTCGQVMLVAEGEHLPTCKDCKPKLATGTTVKLFDAPQTIPGQMTL